VTDDFISHRGRRGLGVFILDMMNKMFEMLSGPQGCACRYLYTGRTGCYRYSRERRDDHAEF